MKLELTSNLSLEEQSKLDLLIKKYFIDQYVETDASLVASELEFIQARWRYVINQVILKTDAFSKFGVSDLILVATGQAGYIPEGYEGFSTGALFIDSLRTNLDTPILYVNIGDSVTAVWKKLNVIARGTPVNSAVGTSTLTSDNTNVSNNDTVVITDNGRLVDGIPTVVTYTFKTSLSSASAAYEVLIGTNADDSLLNLKKAINGEAGGGVKYGSDTPISTLVSCGAVTAHAVTLTSIYYLGTLASLVGLTETSAHLAFDHAALFGGTDSTIGYEGDELYDDNYLYKCIGDTNNDQGWAVNATWRRISLGSAY